MERKRISNKKLCCKHSSEYYSINTRYQDTKMTKGIMLNERYQYKKGSLFDIWKGGSIVDIVKGSIVAKSNKWRGWVEAAHRPYKSEIKIWMFQKGNLNESWTLSDAVMLMYMIGCGSHWQWKRLSMNLRRYRAWEKYKCLLLHFVASLTYL
jgi:hypothetical protein